MDKIQQYRNMFAGSVNKFVQVTYKRKKEITHTISGEVVKIKKGCVIIRIGGELIITIGYRNMKDVFFIP